MHYEVKKVWTHSAQSELSASRNGSALHPSTVIKTNIEKNVTQSWPDGGRRINTRSHFAFVPQTLNTTKQSFGSMKNKM